MSVHYLPLSRQRLGRSALASGNLPPWAGIRRGFKQSVATAPSVFCELPSFHVEQAGGVRPRAPPVAAGRGAVQRFPSRRPP